MSRATDEALDTLHGLLAGALKDELETAMVLSQHPDETKRKPINPQLIDKVLKFLKDNGIDTPEKSKRMLDLADTLGNVDLEREVSLRPNY